MSKWEEKPASRIVNYYGGSTGGVTHTARDCGYVYFSFFFPFFFWYLDKTILTILFSPPLKP